MGVMCVTEMTVKPSQEVAGGSRAGKGRQEGIRVVELVTWSFHQELGTAFLFSVWKAQGRRNGGRVGEKPPETG